jgi:predicted Zn-dependent peptidase
MQTYSKKTINETIYTEKLDNGLFCCLSPKKGYAEKKAALAVNYGSNEYKFVVGNEKRTTPLGIAHFLEHKLFEGENGNAFDKFVELGASLNAYTNYATTAYHFFCTENFDKCLTELLTFTQSPVFTDENVKKEQGIIEQEIKMYQDNPYWKCFFNLMNTMYSHSPVRNDIAGDIESINEITKEILHECYKYFYSPCNTILSCAGELEFEKIIEITKKYMAQKKNTTVKRVYDKEPQSIESDYTEEAMPISRQIYSIGYKDTVSDIKETASAKIMLDCLFGSGSDFYDENYRLGHIDGSFSVEYNQSPIHGTVIFSGNSDNPKDIAERIQRESHTELSQKDFERIKNKHIGRLIRSFNSIDGIVNAHVELFAKCSDKDFINLIDVVETYQDISLADVKNRFDIFDKPCVTSVVMVK